MSELSSVENFLLPSFVEQLRNNNFVFDFVGDESTLSVTVNSLGKKWLRYAKKVDPNFNFDSFVQKVLELTLRTLEKESTNKVEAESTVEHSTTESASTVEVVNQE